MGQIKIHCYSVYPYLIYDETGHFLFLFLFFPRVPGQFVRTYFFHIEIISKN